MDCCVKLHVQFYSCAILVQAFVHLKMSQLIGHHPCPTASSSTEKTGPPRQSANYKKNIWDTAFAESLPSDTKERTCAKRIEMLKEAVKNMLIDDTMGSLTKLELIDTLERLGVGYHFEKEIKNTVGFLSINKDACVDDDLHSTALYFRLLRQHGYKVSLDIFKGFMDEIGSFRQGLYEDVKGILSLYEASHLCFEGEDILYVARDFTVEHLKHLNENTNPSLTKEVTHSLELPLHWRMPRLEARYYIDVCKTEEKMNLTLLELAVLDFNMLQASYQKELSILSRWWKHLGLSDKMSFARDRLVESFLVSIGVAYKPQYECCREWITKAVCLIVTIDDIYDIYGSLDELELFTAAVERWDLNALEQLPDYMKICFLALFNTTNEIIYMKCKDQGLDISSHLKKVWADFCKAMLLEATWSKLRYTPSLAEYLENAYVSSSTTVGLVLAFFGTGQTVTNDALDNLNSYPDLIYYSSMILRLCNDLATSSAELERGDVPSAIQCYMNETNVSEQISRDKIKVLISEMWNKLNKSIYNSPFEDSFNNIVVNSARTAHSIYLHGDGISVQDHETKKRVAELLVKPIRVKNNEFQDTTADSQLKPKSLRPEQLWVDRNSPQS